MISIHFTKGPKSHFFSLQKKKKYQTLSSDPNPLLINIRIRKSLAGIYKLQRQIYTSSRRQSHILPRARVSTDSLVTPWDNLIHIELYHTILHDIITSINSIISLYYLGPESVQTLCLPPGIILSISSLLQLYHNILHNIFLRY